MTSTVTSPPSSRAVDSVARALMFVEESMGQDIGVEDMADAAYYSIFYFSRLFAHATGHAPYDYLMRRRVAASADDVVDSDHSLTEIALERGFDTPDSFARAFRRCFGTSPSEARRARSYPRSLARTPIRPSYAAAMLAAPVGEPRSIEAEPMSITGRWESTTDRGPYSAPGFPGESFILAERDGNLTPIRNFKGLPSDLSPKSTELPRFPTSKSLIPAGRRIRFPVDGDADRLSMIVEFAYRTWLPYAGVTSPPPFDVVVLDGSRITCLELPMK